MEWWKTSMEWVFLALFKLCKLYQIAQSVSFPVTLGFHKFQRNCNNPYESSFMWGDSFFCESSPLKLAENITVFVAPDKTGF